MKKRKKTIVSILAILIVVLVSAFTFILNKGEKASATSEDTKLNKVVVKEETSNEGNKEEKNEKVTKDDSSKEEITKETKSDNKSERYFPEDMPAETMKEKALAISKSKVKAIIYKEVDEHWEAISKYLKQNDKKKVYALFLGLATRESTLNAGLETASENGFGVNPAHAYGCLQTAVTAYKDCNSTFDKEDDVDEMEWYTFTESNFYDPYISTHMGIRKIIHFIKEAESKNLTGIEAIRGALKGFNTGHADYIKDANYYASYVDEIAALGGWYYTNNHYDDEVFTWTDDDKVNRNDPWGWWNN